MLSRTLSVTYLDYLRVSLEIGFVGIRFDSVPCLVEAGSRAIAVVSSAAQDAVASRRELVYLRSGMRNDFYTVVHQLTVARHEILSDIV